MGATVSKSFNDIKKAKQWMLKEVNKAGEMGMYPDSDAMILDLKTMKPHIWDFIPIKKSYKYKLEKSDVLNHSSASSCAIVIARQKYDENKIEHKRFIAMFHVD